VKKIKALLVFTCIIAGSFQFGITQTNTLKTIEKTDELIDSQRAFNSLDSIRKNAKLTPKVKLVLLQKLAQRSLEINDYKLLSKYSIQGINLSRELQKDSLQAYFYKFLGISQVYSKKPEMAIENWKTSAAIAQKANEPYIEVTNYNNIGGTLIDMNEFEEAEKYLLLSIKLSEKNGKWSLRNKLLSTRLLATLYDRTNRQKQAEPIYEKVQLAAYELEDTNLICSNLVFHATFLAKIGKIDKALEKTTEALRLIEPYGDNNSLMTTLQFHSSMLSKAGRYKEAYETYGRAFSLFQENYKAENQLQINQLETQFKTKELEEAKKLADAQSLAEKRQKENYLISLVLVISFVLIAFLVLFLRNTRKNAAIQLRFQHERLASVIEGQEQERSRIAKELHDGIVQDLTLLKMEMFNLNQDSDSTTKLDKITKEVRELSYQMMPVTLRELGLIAAIEELLHRSLSKNGIAFEFEHFNYEMRLADKIEVSVYRICQELLTNVLKHADASRVGVVLRKTDKQLTLIVEDNGKGFDIESSKKGIGLESLNSRIALLNGNLEFDSNEQNGTTAFIRIPIS
jgi:signal transduction histidine kinase